MRIHLGRLFLSLTALACGSLFFAPQSVSAQEFTIIYYISAQDGLLYAAPSNYPGDPETHFGATIAGLQPGEQILAIDFRPKTGFLYGISNQSRLYILDIGQQQPNSGVAALPVGTGAPFSPALDFTARFDIDFNPVVDLVRVVTDRGQNLRVSPETGQVVSADDALAFKAGDVNAGRAPRLVGAAYTNNGNGAASTTLYAIDPDLDAVVSISPPNSGTLNTVGPLGLDASDLVAFDIAADEASNGSPAGAGRGTAFAAFRLAGQTARTARLYKLNLGTGAATALTSTTPNFTDFVETPITMAVKIVPRRALLVSEFRLSGPSGSKDEFIELYNNTDRDIVAGQFPFYTIHGRIEKQIPFGFSIPNGTVIPARGHYLVTNGSPLLGYSLDGYAAGDLVVGSDLLSPVDWENDAGVGIFAGNLGISFTGRIDAVGFTTAPSFYREGAGLPTGGPETSPIPPQYSFYRDLVGGPPKDTDNTAADFVAVNTAGATAIAGHPHRLGAPGPENRTSPIRRDATINGALLDPKACASCAPNRVREFTADPSNNATFGRLSIRRTLTNNTGRPVTRLRFRVIDLTTFGSPGSSSGTQADVRVLSRDGSFTVQRTDGSVVTVQGLSIETPPEQSFGGG
ncbi:MAG: DUF4394 domain-containing protein, partial [Rubrivivax sp.]|nr:DUF4394 domain-containing protein [Pyrinomonadaceae bacterium]